MALVQLLACVAAGLLEEVTFDEEHVFLPATGETDSGTTFQRSLVVSLPQLSKPLRLDALCFFARFVQRQGWALRLAAYVKEAREAAIATVDITDRAKLVALLKTEAEKRASKRLRGDKSFQAIPWVESDGLLPGRDTNFDQCVALHDRNSILLSQTKADNKILSALQKAHTHCPEL